MILSKVDNSHLGIYDNCPKCKETGGLLPDKNIEKALYCIQCGYVFENAITEKEWLEWH